MMASSSRLRRKLSYVSMITSVLVGADQTEDRNQEFGRMSRSRYGLADDWDCKGRTAASVLRSGRAEDLEKKISSGRKCSFQGALCAWAAFEWRSCFVLTLRSSPTA